MRVPLTRFGVAIETPLLAELDELVAQRGCTRSELLRDLARAEVVRSKVARGTNAVASLTIVYDHHVRDLSDKLTDLQHDLGDQVRATLHVHLTHDLCLEVIVMRGRSDKLQAIAEMILATRGVKHGGIEIIAEQSKASEVHRGAPPKRRRAKRAPGHVHDGQHRDRR